MLEDVVVTRGHVLVGHRTVDVRVARQVMHAGEALEAVAQLGGPRVLEIRLYADLVVRNAGDGVGRAVHADEDGFRLVDVFEVLSEPCQLFVVDVGVVAAVLVFVDIVHVVEHDVVDVAQIERVVCGADDPAKRLRSLEVVGELHVVVVVADDLEIGHGEILDLLAVVLERVERALVVPVDVPRQVAQTDGVDVLRAVLPDEGVDVPAEVVAVLRRVGVGLVVVVAVGHVRVGRGQQDVLRVGLAAQAERVLLDDVRCGGRRLPERRDASVGVDHVTARNGDEHRAVLFLRGEPVAAVLVGGGHLETVGDDHALHRHAFAGHLALDRGALPVGDELDTLLRDGHLGRGGSGLAREGDPGAASAALVDRDREGVGGDLRRDRPDGFHGNPVAVGVHLILAVAGHREVQRRALLRDGRYGVGRDRQIVLRHLEDRDGELHDAVPRGEEQARAARIVAGCGVYRQGDGRRAVVAALGRDVHPVVLGFDRPARVGGDGEVFGKPFPGGDDRLLGGFEGREGPRVLSAFVGTATAISHAEQGNAQYVQDSFHGLIC